MELFNKTEDVKKDRVQVLSKAAAACFCPMEHPM